MAGGGVGAQLRARLRPVTLLAWLALAALGAIALLGEARGAMPTRYSRFRAAAGVPSRVGMGALYGAPALVAGGLLVLEAPTGARSLVCVALLAHFGKRCLEVAFVHSYSGPIDRFTVVVIGAFYTAAALAIGRAPAVGGALGVALFTVGEATNLAHHVVLARARGGTLDYVVPEGLLFRWVACPHHLGEIVAWLGILAMSRQPVTLAVVTWMTGYLTGRSLRTLAWYREHLAGWPPDRRALVPGLL